MAHHLRIWAVVGLCSILSLSAQTRKPSADELLKEAGVAADAKDYPKAELWVRELIASYPKDDRGGLALLSLLELEGKFPEALRVAREYQGRYRSNAEFHAQYGRLLATTGRVDEALNEFQTGIQVAAYPAQKAALYELLGDLQRADGNVDQALASFRAAKQITGQPSFGLAMTLGAKGDFDGEIREYRALLGIAPNSAVVMNNLSYAYAERGQNLNEALTYAQLAVGAEPGNAYFVDTLGWVFYKQGRFDQAEAELVRATKMEDGNSSVHWEHLAAAMDGRRVWTPERRELRDLLGSEPTPRKLARVKELLKGMK